MTVRNNFDPQELEEILSNSAQQGKTLRDVARQLNVSNTTVWRWAKSHDIRFNNQSHWRKP